MKIVESKMLDSLHVRECFVVPCCRYAEFNALLLRPLICTQQGGAACYTAQHAAAAAAAELDAAAAVAPDASSSSAAELSAAGASASASAEQ